MTTLIHPETNHEIDVAPSVVERYKTQGWREPANDAPKGNASLEDWQKYARDKGLSDADIEGQSRDDLRSALA